jgi:two-component system, chemotaxis family, protein-glutamate methylesterase/glutaminase
MNKKIRVLVVDDSSFVQKALLRIFDADPEIEVAGVAGSGKEAVEKVLLLKPDVLTLDINMPGMDGLETLRLIMERNPMPVLMLSQFTSEGAELTLKALESGALDFVDKSSTGIMDFLDLAREITTKVKSIAGSKPIRIPKQGRSVPAGKGKGLIDVVAIGTSTGGPLALQMLLPKFPSDINFSLLVVQHMPKGFTTPLARRLDTLCDIRVKEAEDNEVLRPGVALIAPAGMHMTVAKVGNPEFGIQRRILLTAEPENELHKPSVDVLFNSVAKLYGKRSIGVILTGMGSDGVAGLEAVKNAGGFTIAQDEATSAIFGMPRVAIEKNIVDKILPITSIGEEILQRV